MKMAGEPPSVLAVALEARWKTPGAAIAALFPEATAAERAELLGNPPLQKKEHAMVVKGRDGRAINCDVIDRGWRYARDQEPEPNGQGQFQASQVGPQTGSNEEQTMDDGGEEELERLLDELAERLPGAEDRLIRHVHDRRRRRAASDRRRMGRDRRWNEDFSRHEADADQGTNTHASALPRIPRVDNEYDAHAKDRRGRGAHDASPRRDGFFDRFPETRRITIQG